MSYSNTITALDFSGGVANVRVTAGYTWTVLGNTGPVNHNVEYKQDAVVPLDIPSNIFQPGPHTFAYPNNLVPTPSPAWFVALWIQEIPRIVNDTGWLFRSGEFTTEPPADPIEIILAPEELIGAAELSQAVSTPMTSGTTTITSVTLFVVGSDVALSAVGTDTALSAGSTFTYTATLALIPNGGVQSRDLDSPFEIALNNPSLSFTAGPGAGFVTFFLNVMSGIIYNNIAPRIKSTIQNSLNTGILNQVATRLNRGVPSTMPQGVVLSIRSVRATTRPSTTGPGTEAVIGVLGALAAFGGVTNKFPALSTAGGGCFIATAAAGPDAPELPILREWRDVWLRSRTGGAKIISLYERLSPPLALRIAKSPQRQAFVRKVLIAPATRLARLLLGR